MISSRRQAAWFLLPWSIGFTLLTLLPVLASLALSLTKDGGPIGREDFRWTGLDHYVHALGVDSHYVATEWDPWYWRWLGGRPNDPRYYASLYNTLYYCLLAVPLGLGVSLAAALLLNQPLRGMSTARAFVYLPHVLGGAASIVIWSWLLNPQFGWINHGIRLIYIALDPFVHLLDPRGTQDWPTPRWLYSADSCKPAVILIHVWTIGGSMLVFLAGLRRVPAYLYEAARVDGAGGWARFRNVTWPQLTPILLFNGVVSCVFAMQCFNEAYLLQNRQQDDGLLFYALYVYQSAFEPPYRLGFASALGWILFVLMLFMVSAIGCSSRWWVSYSGVEIHKRS